MVQIVEGSPQDQLFNLVWNRKWVEANELVEQDVDSVLDFTGDQFISVLKHIITLDSEDDLRELFTVFDLWFYDVIVGDTFTLEQWKLLVSYFKFMDTEAIENISVTVLSNITSLELFQILVQSHFDKFGNHTILNIISYYNQLEQLNLVGHHEIVETVDHLLTIYEELPGVTLTDMVKVILEDFDPFDLEIFSKTNRPIDIPYDELFKMLFDIVDISHSGRMVNDYFLIFRDNFGYDARQPFTTPYSRDGEIFNSPREYIERIMEDSNDGEYVDVLETIDEYPGNWTGQVGNNVEELNEEAVDEDEFYDALVNHNWDVAKQLIEEVHPSVENITIHDVFSILKELLASGSATELENFFKIMNLYKLSNFLADVFDYEYIQLLIQSLQYMVADDRIYISSIIVGDRDYDEVPEDGYSQIVSNVVTLDGPQEFMNIIHDFDDMERIDKLFDIYEELYTQSEGNLPPLIDVLLSYPNIDPLGKYIELGREIDPELKINLYSNYIEDHDIEDTYELISWIKLFYDSFNVSVYDKFTEPYEGFETPMEYFLDYFSDKPRVVEYLKKETRAQLL